MNTTLHHCILVAFVAVIVLPGCRREQESIHAKAVTNAEAQSAVYYSCPMHPWIRRHKPGACPICGMTLVKASGTEGYMDSTDAPGSVRLSPEEQVHANVSVAIVQRKALIKEILAVGKIGLAEPAAQQIIARFAGRIERLFVSFVGQKVQSGQPVAEMYSPDAVDAQREFLVALNSPSTPSGESALVKQARLKLKLLGFTEGQIDQLARDQTPSTTTTIHSYVSGTVLKKNVDLQQYVSAGEPLFEVTDLRSVWLQLEIYEADIAAVRIGQAVEASIDTSPPLTIRGTVSFISPTLDPVTRTARVRAILDNPSGNLKPEMYARARILVPLAKSLVVPASAVISNGRRDIVWIEREPGRFELRQVVLGERTDEFYQILDGLYEGEAVADKGAFLIDSESQLRLSNTGSTDE